MRRNIFSIFAAALMILNLSGCSPFADVGIDATQEADAPPLLGSGGGLVGGSMPPKYDTQQYLQNWMAKTEQIHDKKLKEITFPASHDAGTWEFQNEISDDPDAMLAKELISRGDSLNSWIQGLEFKAAGYNIKLGSKLGSIANDVTNKINTTVLDAIKLLSQATDKNLTQQLNTGIRWFDLRIDLTDKGVYTHHFLLGVRMEDALNQVLDFVKSTNGEIVVLEMSHYSPKDEGKYNNFVQTVNNKLGSYAYKETEGNPFLKTYNEITANGSKSRVILISDGAPAADTSGMLWTSEKLGIAGSYANKSCSKAMIDDQVAKLGARDQSKVFALWLNLTGSKEELAQKTTSNIIATTLDGLYNLISPALNDLPVVDIDGWCVYDPIFGTKLFCVPGTYVNPNDEVKKLFKGLLQDKINELFDINTIMSAIGVTQSPTQQDQACIDENKNKPWSSLKQLSDKVSPNIQTILEGNFQDPSQGYNRLSVIYADYIEPAGLVAEAISYSKMPGRDTIGEFYRPTQTRCLNSGGYWFLNYNPAECENYWDKAMKLCFSDLPTKQDWLSLLQSCGATIPSNANFCDEIESHPGADLVRGTTPGLAACMNKKGFNHSVSYWSNIKNRCVMKYYDDDMWRIDRTFYDPKEVAVRCR